MFAKALAAICSIGLVYACVGAGGSPAAQSPGGKAHKGGGSRGTAAKDSGQRVGGHAATDKSKGKDEGASYEDVECDAGDEGLAWCDSANEIAFCSGGEWWVLDCTHPDIDGDFCGDNGSTVDCYVASEVE